MNDETITHLLRLLDDDSPTVQAHIREQLLGLGAGAERRIEDAAQTMPMPVRHRAEMLLREFREAETMQASWYAWQRMPDPWAKLEYGLELIARMQYEWTPPVTVSELLDELAEEYLEAGGQLDPISMSRFLFVIKDFNGEADDYFDPLHSNMIHVLQSGYGLPISLCSVYMLLGWRLGVMIHGCALPGYFITRSDYKGDRVFVDCFNGGRIMTRAEVVRGGGPLPSNLHFVLEEPAPTEQILGRVANNLVYAYTLRNDEYNADRFAALGDGLQDMLTEEETRLAG
jgi:regulator of sirC expression with transglutaminase-like and TPR domain